MVGEDIRYYVFDTYCNIADRECKRSEGYTVFEKNNDKLVEILHLNWNREGEVPSREQTLELLAQKGIRKVGTCNVGRSFLGLECVDEGGLSILYSKIPEIYLESFKELGIEVIFVDQ